MSPIVRPRILVRHCCALQKHKRHMSDGCVTMKKKKQKQKQKKKKKKQIIGEGEADNGEVGAGGTRG